jgi:hypothetical protein
MPPNTPVVRRPPTAREVTIQQYGKPADKAAAVNSVVPTGRHPLPPKAGAGAGAVTPATEPQLPAVASDRSGLDEYLDQADPSGMPGPPVKFSKAGDFTRIDTDEVLTEQMWIARYDHALVGLRRFHGPGVPPTQHMGLAFDPDFRMPDRESLGDLDQEKWEHLDGKPVDPWQVTSFLPLEHPETHELLCRSGYALHFAAFQ